MRFRGLRSAYTLGISLMLTVFLAASGISDGYKYESHGKRDPFVPLVGSGKAVKLGLKDAASIADVKLEGIASGSGSKLIAILNGEIVKEGDRFGNVEITKITGKSVMIVMSGKKYVIGLIEEEGAKNGR